MKSNCVLFIYLFILILDGPNKKQDGQRPSWAIFIKTSQHREPVLFKEKFFDWPNIHPLITQKNFENNSKVNHPSNLNYLLAKNEHTFSIKLVLYILY